MSNSYFDWPASSSRFAPYTKARAEDVNATFDSVSYGFDLITDDLALKAPIASPTFTGVVTLPSPGGVGESSTKAATTAWVQSLVGSLSVGLPSQSGNTDKALTTNGTSASWRATVWLTERPLLQDNTGYTLVAPLGDLVSGNYDTLLGVQVSGIAYGSGLYVATCATTANVSSSPDGQTWTLRAMPATKTWVLGSDGTNFMAVVSSDTAVAKSAEGVTWSSATALPAGVTNVRPPIKVGGLWLVGGISSTAYYTSTDGTAWTSRTFPAVPTAILLIGSTAWIRTASTTAYTSTDGINWTVRTIDAAQTQAWVCDDGTAKSGSNGTDNRIWSTSDGITWTQDHVGMIVISAGAYAFSSINGVDIAIGGGHAGVWNEGRWARIEGFGGLPSFSVGVQWSIYSSYGSTFTAGGKILTLGPRYTSGWISLIESGASGPAGLFIQS